eukprot:948382-Pyramimonas_sp.AAC.1
MWGKIVPIPRECVHVKSSRAVRLRSVQDGQTGPQDRPKTLQEAARRAPRRLLRSPWRPQERARTGRERSRR